MSFLKKLYLCSWMRFNHNIKEVMMNLRNWLNFKTLAPYIVAFLIFIIVPVIYFAPQYEDKDIRKFDDIQAESMVAPILDHINKYGEHPNWVSNMFGGMPSYTLHLESTADPIRKISTWLYFLGAPASYYFLLMLGFFFMLRCFKVNPWLAVAGSLAYGLSSYFIIIYEAGHIMKIIALIFAAPLVGSLYYTYHRSTYLGASLFGVFTLLEVSSVHPQITYYFIIAMIIMVISIFVADYKEKQLKRFFIASLSLIVTVSLAVGANIIYLYYTADYAKDSIRGKMILTDNSGATTSDGLDKDYITAWSYGKMESFNMFIPNATGGKSGGGFSNDGEVAKSLKKYTGSREAQSIAEQLPGYWGPQPMTSGPVYIGAVMVFLFVLGLFLVRGYNLWWIVISSVLALALAWGKNLMWLTDLFIDFFPLYNKFRTVSMILVVLQLTVPLLGILALNELLKGAITKPHFKKSLLYSLYITGGVCLLFILFGGSMFDFLSSTDYQMGVPEDVVQAMSSERLSMLRSDAWRSLGLVAATAGLVWLLYNNKMSTKWFSGAIIALVLIDMVPVDMRYLNHSMFEPKIRIETKMNDLDKQILQDSNINYRVMNLSTNTFSDAVTSRYHRSVGGYFAAKPRRYQDMIDRYLSKGDMNVLNMLNTKYFIVPVKDSNPVIQVNEDAYGNAWVVDKIDWVTTADDEIGRLGETDLSEVAVVGQEFKNLVGDDVVFAANEGDKIEHTEYKANRMVYKSNFSAPRVVVFSEIYYPKGWTAYIDGEKNDYFRANYLLNAMVVPAGEHEIVFEFEVPHIKTFKTIASICSSLLLLLLIVGVVLHLKNNNNHIR